MASLYDRIIANAKVGTTGNTDARAIVQSMMAQKKPTQPKPVKPLTDVEKAKLQFAEAGYPMPTQSDINRLYQKRDALTNQRDSQTWDKKTIDNTGLYNQQIKDTDRQIADLAQLVPNAQLRSNTPYLDWAMSGLSGTMQQFATTALKNPIFPTAQASNIIKNITGVDVAQKAMDLTINKDVAWENQRIAANQESMGKEYDVLGTLIQGTTAALPQAVLAIATGGASAVEALPALGANAGLGTVITSGLSKMVQSPLFAASFGQTYGASYNQAIASGASEDQAQLTATLVGIINSAVELTGGLETLPAALQSGNTSAISGWVSSMLDEGKEEVVQGVIERLTNKMVYIDPSRNAITKQMKSTADSINTLLGSTGNVDYNKRQYLTGADMKKSGWNDSDLRSDDTVTTYTIGYYGSENINALPQNKGLYIELTPVRDDGTILSPDELNAYADKLFASTNIKQADASGNKILVVQFTNPTDQQLEDFQNKFSNLKGQHADLHDKLQNAPSAPLYSTTDPNAVFNYKTAAQEFGGGAAIGGILGGGQIAAQSAINSIAQSQGGKPQNTALNANSNTTATLKVESAVQNLPTVETDNISAEAKNITEESVKSGEATIAGLPIKYNPANKGEASNHTSYIDVGDKFFELPQRQQQNILVHEVSHNTASQHLYKENHFVDIMTNPAFGVSKTSESGKPYWEGIYGDTGATAVEETFTQAVADYLDDAEWLKSNHPEAYSYIAENVFNTTTQPTMPEGMGAASDAVDDLGAAKGGLYQTNQWSAPDKYAVNTNRNPDLDNLPTEKAQVVLESPKNQKTLKDRWNSFYKHVVDNQHGASRFDKVAGSNVSMWMSNARSANGIVNNALNGELRDFDGNRLGDSLHSVLSQIPKAEMKDFFTYAYHSHNINRAVMGNNIFTNFNKEQSAQKVKEAEAAHPEWQQYRDDIVNWIATFSKAWSVDTGLVSEDIYNNNRVMYPNYIPSHRVFEEIEKAMTGGSIGDKFVDVSSQMRKATGSDRNMNPLVNIANLVHKTINAATYNKAGQEIYKAIESDPTKMAEFGEIVSEGSNLNNVVSVLIDGQRKYMKLYDADLLEALNGLPKATKALPVVSKLTAAFKGLITQYNILFGIKNLMRDIPTGYAYGNEGNPFKYLKGEAKALKEIITNGEMYRLYKSVGGGMSNYVNKSALEKFAYGLAKQQSGAKAIVRKIGGGIEAYNAAIETMTRLNEFMTVYNKTGDPHKALDASNNVTVNFARGGDIIKAFDKNGAAYLNASVQGLDKFVRSFSTPRAAVTMLARAGLSVTLPTFVLYLINMANPHYDDEDDRNKDAYYLIPNPLGPKDEDGYCETFIRIPKSREFGALFGALFERILRWSGGESADSAFKGIGTTIGTNFAPNNPLTDNIFTPVIRDLKANKDFAGRTIVPQSMQKLSPHLQYDEKTSELSKFISDMAYKAVGAEWSPKVMDFLIDSYTGIIGDILLPATTKGGDPLSPFTRAFVTDSVYNNQTLTNFYDNMDKAARAAADQNLLEGIPSKEITHAERISNMYSNTSKKITALSKISARVGVGALTDDDTDALKALGIDTTLKPSELQREIKKAQIDMAKSAIARAENGSDMELDMYNNSNIKNTVDKYAKAGLSQTQAYELYNSFKELQPLPGKENVSDLQKYELIVNSKLNQSDTLKALSVAMGDTKTYSNMMIAVKAGLSPKRFIQIYSATNNMKSDKDADGKDIKGQTKQDKVWDYINKLGVSIDQKNALHYAMGYAESSLKNAPWYKK